METKYDNSLENRDQYIWRMCKAKDDGILDLNWDDLATIINEELYDDEADWLGSSAYRKRYQYAKSIYDNVFCKMESQDFQDKYFEQKRELERLKIQFRDERNAWNKQNYIDARVEQKLDYLEECIANLGKINFTEINTGKTNSDNDLYIMLSDLHIGQSFKSNWGEYNSDIAKERLEQYLDEIVLIAERHHSENAFVSIQGDLLSGSIHKSLQITNRENVIEQIKLVSEMISSFCYRLSKYFKHVTIVNVSGNHSRIDKKEDALHDERLDDLVGWIVSNSLSHLDNITFKNDNIDVGIASLEIRGKEYISVHGDYDTFTSNGVNKLCMMLQRFPYAISYGHLHHSSMDETNGIKMIRSGSLAGSGDAYTIEKRLSGKASQMVCVCTNKGIEAFYPIELD